MSEEYKPVPHVLWAQVLGTPVSFPTSLGSIDGTGVSDGDVIQFQGSSFTNVTPQEMLNYKKPTAVFFEYLGEDGGNIGQGQLELRRVRTKGGQYSTIYFDINDNSGSYPISSSDIVGMLAGPDGVQGSHLLFRNFRANAVGLTGFDYSIDFLCMYEGNPGLLLKLRKTDTGGGKLSTFYGEVEIQGGSLSFNANEGFKIPSYGALLVQNADENLVLVFQDFAGAVAGSGYITFYSGIAGSLNPAIKAVGATNMDLDLDANGTGTVNILSTLKVDEIGELTSASGVTIDGVLIKDGGITLNSGVAIDGFLDEDDMASDSASHAATQQSIKAYVDAASGGGGLSALEAAMSLAESRGGKHEIYHNYLGTPNRRFC
jgi:hypothetical protein